jgi:hypothetical protein
VLTRSVKLTRDRRRKNLDQTSLTAGGIGANAAASRSKDRAEPRTRCGRLAAAVAFSTRSRVYSDSVVRRT